MAMSRTLPTAILRLAADRVRLTPPAPAGQPPRRARAPLGESPAMSSLRLDAAVRPTAAPELAVRPACRYADTAALEALAARAGARALRGGGHVLVAEWAGRIVAAVSLHDGRAVGPGGPGGTFPPGCGRGGLTPLCRCTTGARSPIRARRRSPRSRCCAAPRRRPGPRGLASPCRGCPASRPAVWPRRSPDRGA